MITFSIQSGSNGNCIFVQADGVCLLFDAGVSGRTLKARLAARGYAMPMKLDALFVSHEHSDHIRCAGVVHRMFGAPLYVTRSTLGATHCNLGALGDVHHFRAGQSLTIGSVTVHTIPTEHDAVDGVAFVVESAGRRLGIFTDLGHPFAKLAEALDSVDAAYLESNYDPTLLKTGPYPEMLKRRIAGPGGHLSNEESAQLVREAGPKRHRWIALSHLSEQNNRPELALETHRQITGSSFPYVLASRYEVSPCWEV